MRFPVRFVSVIAAAAMAVCPLSTSPVPADAAEILTMSQFMSPEYQVRICSDTDEAAVYLRKQMTQKADIIYFSLPSSLFSGEDTVSEVMSKALAETGVSTEGDYLRLSLKSYASYWGESGNTMVIRLNIDYITDTEQEAELTEKLGEVMASLSLDGRSDYQKALIIYDYVTQNVDYPTASGWEVSSAYSALVNKTAVCQGFAQLIYRMFTEAGIRCRFVGGSSNGVMHAWNIAYIDGAYYYIDATWDSMTLGRRLFFLKGTKDLDEYIYNGQNGHDTDPAFEEFNPIYEMYGTDDFLLRFPLSDVKYDPADPVPAYLPGDVDNDKTLDPADASQILRAYSYFINTDYEVFTLSQRNAADVSGDGVIDSSDASIILSYYSETANGSDISFEDYLKTLQQ